MSDSNSQLEPQWAGGVGFLVTTNSDLEDVVRDNVPVISSWAYSCFGHASREESDGRDRCRQRWCDTLPAEARWLHSKVNLQIELAYDIVC